MRSSPCGAPEAMSFSTAVMISATPALSSAPSSVEPSVTSSTFPRTSFMAGNCFSERMTPWPSSISSPVYKTSRAFTPSPLAAGEVSTCAISASVPAALTPSVAGSVPMALPQLSMWTFFSPSESISSARQRESSSCRAVDGLSVLSSSDAVDTAMYFRNRSLQVITGYLRFRRCILYIPI